MQMKTPKHGPRPRRRWASLFVVAIAWLIASTSARAGDDGHDWSLKAETDEGISQVWQAQGVPSEEGFFRAWFVTFENPNVKPASTPWERTYAAFLWTCAQRNHKAYLAALTPEERASIENLLFAYATTLTADFGRRFPSRCPRRSSTATTRSICRTSIRIAPTIRST